MLAKEQKTHFESKGFLVIENLIAQEVLECVRSEYAKLVDDLYATWYRDGLVAIAPEGLSFWDKLDQGYANQLDVHQPLTICLPHGDVRSDSPMHMGPAIFDLIRHERILDVVQDLIGPEITASPIQHVRIKPPQSAARSDELRAHVVATGWHQDKGVTLAEANETTMVTVWVAITDATLENGCLQVAKSGPTNDLLPHCCRKQVEIIDEYLPAAENIQPTPVKAGGAVIFHPLTPHASRPDLSDEYRWSFDLRYNISGQPTGRSQFPEIVVRSSSDPSSEVADWRDLKAMWDDTRAQLATTPVPLSAPLGRLEPLLRLMGDCRHRSLSA
ncbi:MAG: phytanoyl-CoA dioxygenase family protein [Pseudomonadota bacterium]